MSCHSNYLSPTDWSLLRTVNPFEGGAFSDLGTSHSLLRFYFFKKLWVYVWMCVAPSEARTGCQIPGSGVIGSWHCLSQVSPAAHRGSKASPVKATPLQASNWLLCPLDKSCVTVCPHGSWVKGKENAGGWSRVGVIHCTKALDQKGCGSYREPTVPSPSRSPLGLGPPRAPSSPTLSI